MPAERLPIELNADGVRSMTRLVPHVDPQQTRSPQNWSVAGPQSAMVTATHLLLHRFSMKNL